MGSVILTLHWDGLKDVQNRLTRLIIKIKTFFIFVLEIHETVAECMIMANHWVARKIAEVFPVFSLLRLHPPPKKVFYVKFFLNIVAQYLSPLFVFIIF